MIAGIYFDHEKWLQMLRDKGCTPVQDAPVFHGVTKDYYLWQTPWGHKFLVPHHCTYDEAETIIKREVEDTKPTQH